MGLFDFLKKKAEPEQKATQPYLGDLKKTDILFQLVQIPQEQRDAAWQEKFLENAAQASFRCGDPQVVTGPDGFPYFQLHLPEPNKEFQCFVIDRMKDDFLLNSGFGVVINPTGKSADWVFSYGDIVNLAWNETFYTTTETPFSNPPGQEILTEDEEVLIAQPSEQLLPKNTRAILSDFLKMNGVKNPKVLLLSRRKKDGDGLAMDIVFNLTPADFTDEEQYRAVMRSISWYLPRHYTYVGMDEKSIDNGFMPL